MIYEIRRETAAPGRGRELARWMDEQVIPVHQAAGMTVVGSFTDAGDPDAFVWIRAFRDAQEREETVARVHRDPVFATDIRPRLGAFLAAEAVTVHLIPTARSGLA